MKTFRFPSASLFLPALLVLLASPPAARGDDATNALVAPFADLRLRFEAFDAIPLANGAYARGGENAYFRIRTRAGVTLLPDSPLSINARLLHEFRGVLRPVHSHSWRWPDELVPDALNLAYRDPSGLFAATLGRQDLAIPGALRYLGDGTPKDGSRSSYMNALAATLQTPSRDTRLDLFAAYDPDEDPLAIGHLHRDLNTYLGPAQGMDEAGAGAFLRQRLPSLSPLAPTNPAALTVAYLWKHDSHWRSPATATPDAADASMPPPPVRHPSEDIHTAVLHLDLPVTPTLLASAETAHQLAPTSASDRRAWLADVALARTFPDALGAALTARLLYLTGDDPSTPENEAWNPLWARYPWYSELLLYASDADPAPWQNLLAPTLEARVPVAPRQTLRAQLATLHAPEASPLTGSHSRGILATARYDFPVLPALLPDALTSHVQLETLFPGNYYPTHNPAYFLRFELTYSFK